MDTYGKRLDAALAAKAPKDRTWLAAQLGVSVQAISQVIIGKTRALTAENHEFAIRALGCSGFWLATGQGEMFPVTADINGKLPESTAGVCVAEQTVAPYHQAVEAINNPATTIERFLTLLDAADELTRGQVKHLLVYLCDHPGHCGDVIGHMMKHFSAANASSAADAPPESYRFASR